MSEQCPLYVEDTASRCDLLDRHPGPHRVDWAARHVRKLDACRAALLEIANLGPSESRAHAKLIATVALRESWQ